MPGISQFVKKRKNGFSFAALLVVCLILILISNRNIALKPKSMGQSLLSVFQLGIHGVASWFADTMNSIGELKRLQEELEQTRKRLLEYQRVSRDVAELRRENRKLKEQLGFSRSLPFRQIPAEVVARDPGNQFSTLVVNKGSRQGVEKGMSVVAFRGGLEGLVGKIVSVGLVTSTVKPITDPTSYVAARLQSSRFDGLVSGSRLQSGNLVMHYVRKLAVEEVQYGELVITSGMGMLYPKGIHIGRVREMQAESYEASLELEVEPIIDFSRLEYVFILAEEKEEEVL